jgi:hypothetical protein
MGTTISVVIGINTGGFSTVCSIGFSGFMVPHEAIKNRKMIAIGVLDFNLKMFKVRSFCLIISKLRLTSIHEEDFIFIRYMYSCYVMQKNKGL